jgi:6-pyruvoyltetrahydropterin/6-carboxytetrahydropterin synthase
MVVRLARTVRFCINDGDSGSHASNRDNTFAGSPAMRGLGRYYELEVVCRGEVDGATGYFLNIKEIDRTVRSACVPLIARACVQQASVDPALVLGECVHALNAELGSSVESVRWRLTPYYSVQMATTSDMTGYALLRQQFDFAAAHRLNVDAMSAEENRRVFGKCNNLNGHGHNYRFEPCVKVRVGAGGMDFGLVDLERVAARTILDRFDHTHMNMDTPEFDCSRGGVNPSVENIAKVFFDLLAPAIARETKDATLVSMTVWETDKTSATYPA